MDIFASFIYSLSEASVLDPDILVQWCKTTLQKKGKNIYFIALCILGELVNPLRRFMLIFPQLVIINQPWSGS